MASDGATTVELDRQPVTAGAGAGDALSRP
jgi:hypothetical protein